MLLFPGLDFQLSRAYTKNKLAYLFNNNNNNTKILAYLLNAIFLLQTSIIVYLNMLSYPLV